MNIKNINKILFSGFFLAVLFSCLGFTTQSELLSTKIIRMHVRANSNSDYDQNIKIQVKDEVVNFAEKIMNEQNSYRLAKQSVVENLDEIKIIANQKLVDLKTPYTANVKFEEEFFPTREYDTFTLPAGNYQSLVVEIGTAKGENWWCVVYPSLCTATSIKDCSEKLESEEIEIITETPEVSFFLYEWYLQIQEFFKK